ncbi:MAG: hypothetical protein ACO3H6_00155 [Bacilli bacterium]
MEHIGKVNVPSLYPLIIFQFLFLISFQAFNLPFVYGLMVIVLVTALWLTGHKSLSEDSKTDLGLMVIAILLFTLFLSLSPFYLETSTWLRSALIAVSFPAFYMLGFWLVRVQSFSIEKLMSILVIGLSLFVLINVLYTVYRYGPWYQWLYAGQVIYVNGEVYTVSEEVKWLMGLQFVEVKASYMDVYLTILLMPFFAHLKTIFQGIRWQKDAWWMLSGVTGFLGVILLPTMFPFIISGLISLGFYGLNLWPTWMKRHQKIRLIALWTSVSVLAFMVVLFFIDTYNLFNLRPVLTSIYPLNRILDFPLVEGYQSVLRSLPQYPFGGFAPILVNGRYVLSTQSIVFDTLHQAGLFAFAGLVLIAVFFINQLRVFDQQGSIAIPVKMTLIMIVVVFMFQQTFFLHTFPYVREALRNRPRLMHEEPLWQLMFMLMGMIMVDPLTGMMKKTNA